MFNRKIIEQNGSLPEGMGLYISSWAVCFSSYKPTSINWAPHGRKRIWRMFLGELSSNMSEAEDRSLSC